MEAMETQTVFKTIHEVDNDAIIININGWRMRVWFDEELPKSERNKLKKGNTILIEYIGELDDVHNLELLPIVAI